MFRTDAVALLCDLVAARGRSFEPSALPAECQGALPFLRGIGAIQDGDLPSVVTCEACDENHPARLEYDPAARGYWHFCPEVGHVDVRNESLATMRVDPEWIVRWLSRAFPIVSGRCKALVADSVWHLGDAILGGTEITVLFAAQISTQCNLADLADALRHVYPADLGLVITTSVAPTPSLSLPNGFRVLDLREIARADDDHLDIDRAKLAGWVKGFRSGRGKPARSGPGRPTEHSLVEEIARKRRDDALSLSVRRQEAQAIRTEFVKRYPARPVPAVKTIEKHLRAARC